VTLGPRAGDFYLVRHGLQEGELVVTRGNFKIDSALQIQARPSMVSVEGDAPFAVPESFRQQLAPLYDRYLDLQEALADDRADDAHQHWQALQAAMDELPESAVDLRLDEAWSVARRELAAALDAGSETESIGPMRAQFEPLAEAMLDVARVFGHPRERPLYEVHCPMAFSNRGASWLQAGETVANPYFGHAMLRCGDITRPFPPSTPSTGGTQAPGGADSGSPPQHRH
jgi:Cu(I)/Ag(I) efflux system membrane fusion protein